MDYNVATFKEPRGVMRILHFIFSICAFATISGYSGYVKYQCTPNDYTYNFAYPFKLALLDHKLSDNCTTTIIGNFSSDASFFVATGVLAMLYAIAVMVVYLRFDDLYKLNNKLPILDFVCSVIFGVLWLSSSAAWAHGLSGLKYVTDATNIELLDGCHCASIITSNYSTLTISVIFGFLNFFLWAADLWFLYKETVWFQGNQQQEASSGV